MDPEQAEPGAPRTDMPSPDEPRGRVKPAEDMPDEIFRKHMVARHLLGGMTELGASNIPGDEHEGLLRAYHAKVHEMGVESDGGHKRVVWHDHVNREGKA